MGRELLQSVQDKPDFFTLWLQWRNNIWASELRNLFLVPKMSKLKVKTMPIVFLIAKDVTHEGFVSQRQTINFPNYVESLYSLRKSFSYPLSERKRRSPATTFSITPLSASEGFYSCAAPLQPWRVSAKLLFVPDNRNRVETDRVWNQTAAIRRGLGPAFSKSWNSKIAGKSSEKSISKNFSVVTISGLIFY